MNKKWITQKEIIKLMKEDWEMGIDYNTKRCWLQKKLCCGGDTFNVNGNTFNSLLKKGIIEFALRQINDSFWLRRYRLKIFKKGDKNERN